MSRSFRKRAGRLLSRFIASLNPFNDREPEEEKLGFTALAERQKLSDGRLPTPSFDPHAPRKTPAQQRREIEDRPIP
jgi:hypothetical protein